MSSNFLSNMILYCSSNGFIRVKKKNSSIHVHPGFKLVLIKAESQKKHNGENLAKLRQILAKFNMDIYFSKIRFCDVAYMYEQILHWSCDINSINCSFLRKLRIILFVPSLYHHAHHFIPLLYYKHFQPSWTIKRLGFIEFISHIWSSCSHMTLQIKIFKNS